MNTPYLRDFSVLSAADKKSVWLQVGTLIDGVSSSPLHNAHIVYNAESILYVGNNKTAAATTATAATSATATATAAINEPDLELPNFTLLPGLIEAHAHLFLDGSELDIEKRKAQLNLLPQEMLHQAQSRLGKLLQSGIIAVRDAGDKFGVGLSLNKLYHRKDDISKRDVIFLPYIDSPGAAINHKGSYGNFMAEPIENFSSLRECVESRINAGAERIKIIATDVIDFKAGRVKKPPQMTVEEISEIVKTAKEFGKQVFAHASGEDGIERAIEGGVDSIEHAFFIREDQLSKMRDKNIAWCPTFTPIQKQIDYADRLGWDTRHDISRRDVMSALKEILDQHSTMLLKAHQIGVTIIAGSDAGSYGVVHGLGLLDEMELMERAGLSPLAIINAATGNSSNRLAFKEKFGQIKAGYKSRFILTLHSPLESIFNLRKEKYVVVDGNVLKDSKEKSFYGM